MKSENHLRIKNKEKMEYWGKLGYSGTQEALVQG